MLGEKVIIILLIAGLIKKISLYKVSYYPEPDGHGRNKIKGQLDFSNYATKTVSNVTGDDTLDFAENAELASLKSDVDKLDINILKTAPSDFSRLSNVVENGVVKNTVYDELIKKFNADDPSKLVTKLTKTRKLGKKNLTNHNGYITANKFIKFHGEIFDEKLKQAKLTTKNDIDDLITKTYFDDKIKKINEIKQNI